MRFNNYYKPIHSGTISLVYDGTYQNQKVIIRIKRRDIEEKLKNFQGFDGKGYFILGKSFLKNLLAFCATYFIILIQFKL